MAGGPIQSAEDRLLLSSAGEALEVGERTSATVQAERQDAYRSICLWLGHFYAILVPWRWFLIPESSLRLALTLEAVVAAGVFYGAGACIRTLSRWLRGLENLGLLLVGVGLVNNVFLVAWLRTELQLANFLLVQVCASAAFRSAPRFILAQLLCLGSAACGLILWVSPQAFWSNLFILLSGLLVSAVIWAFLGRLLKALAVLRAKDRLLLRQRDRLVVDLQAALDSVRTLSGLIPICAHCKRVRDDEGYWQQVEAYVHARSEARFSHGICPECRVGVERDLAAYLEGSRPAPRPRKERAPEDPVPSGVWTFFGTTTTVEFGVPTAL